MSDKNIEKLAFYNIKFIIKDIVMSKKDKSLIFFSFTFVRIRGRINNYYYYYLIS